ncbi:DUF7673 family protein [Sphingomonas sp. CCH9-F2]|uniref:DUF7673 family protein n=1 Tax=Sphingomonadales TaxID=204457 RepID=UPI000B33B8BD|nr:hypothetical protein [Sphingomonas sp. CCH9-F2]
MQPQRRPLIRALAFDEVGAAIGRLVDVASSDTGQAARVADFLGSQHESEFCVR